MKKQMADKERDINEAIKKVAEAFKDNAKRKQEKIIY